MIYVPEWEALAAGLARIMSTTGADEPTARTALCQAILDKKIAVSAIVAKGEYWAGKTVRGKQIEVPLRLQPAAFDWDESRPVEPWDIGRYPDDIDWGPRKIETIEVSTRDLFAVFGGVQAVATKVKNKPGLSTKARRDIFRDWRASRGENIPTIEEDTAEMQRRGIGRDDVRQLRKDHQNRPAGKPKATDKAS